MVEDLVRPRAADAGDRALVAEERMQAMRRAPQDLREVGGGEAECLRAEVRDFLLGGGGREQPDAGALPACILGEHQL